MFRATTLASTLMEQYMKATATPFVHHALKDTILKIMESKQSCEVEAYNGSSLTHTDANANLFPHPILFLLFTLLYLTLLVFACSKLNPSKLEKNEDVNLNLAHLLNILSELVEKIFMAAEILPP